MNERTKQNPTRQRTETVGSEEVPCGRTTPSCPGCGRPCHEIPDVVAFAREENMTPEQWVREEEGTYNPENEHFLCDSCFLKCESKTGHRLVGKNGSRWICP